MESKAVFFSCLSFLFGFSGDGKLQYFTMGQIWIVSAIVMHQVPTDLDIRLQGLALIQGQIYKPDLLSFSTAFTISIFVLISEMAFVYLTWNVQEYTMIW